MNFIAQIDTEYNWGTAHIIIDFNVQFNCYYMDFPKYYYNVIWTIGPLRKPLIPGKGDLHGCFIQRNAGLQTYQAFYPKAGFLVKTHKIIFGV